MANRGASSSSASFTKSWKYHVFLSFRGVDTRHNFTDHLYSALCERGINTFRDDDELRRGEEISNALLTAIEDSKISVVVLSKNYASSKSCLDELVKILDCKESNQQLVIPVFYKVNPSDVQNHRGSFGDALANMDCSNVEKVDRWKKALSQAGELAGFTLSDERQSESKFIQNIIEEISKHVLNRVCLEVAEHPVGMHHPVEDITKLLDLGEKDVRMVGVWGTGGIGKTTIAKAVYNSIAQEFEVGCFLGNVRECSMSHGGLAKLQKTLLFKILRGQKLKVTNVDEGVTMIKERLRRRKVLLVLDDVDDMEQLHKLVGACDWFGVGSRVIITTRDKQLLTAHDVNLIHEVKILDYHKAVELFCWHAFKRRGPPLGDYVKLAERAIRYAQGLPLALKVLGSCLCGGSIDKWEAALNGFKSKKIQDVLKISYDALDDERVKEVFLDLACFFKGKSRSYAIETLEACDLNPGYGIEVLVEKALITVESDYIQMHDLLEEMGKEIVRQESPNVPGERSRLWCPKDVEQVLTNNTGTNKIIGIMLNFPKNFPNHEIFLDVGRSFSKMKNLKILINYNVCLSGDASSIPNNLRVLDWYKCPFQSFPANFRPKALVVLNLPQSRIKQIGETLQHLTKLTSLNLSGSEFLTEIPDLSGSPNLKSLDASGCRSLVEVDASIGYLHKLEGLHLSETAIKELPSSIGHLHKLEKLHLNHTAIKELPSSIGHLTALEKLSLRSTAIRKLPSSVGNLTALRYLWLDGNAIEELPSSIGNLTALRDLWLSGSAIEELPSSIGNLTALRSLWLSGSAIEELPSSIGNLTELRQLLLRKCENLANLPQSIYGLQNLGSINLNQCPKLITLPNNLISEVLSSAESLTLEVRTKSFSSFEIRSMCFEECNVSDIDSLENFCCWSNLTKINLSKSNFVRLPVCVSKCVCLRELKLRGCKKLVEIAIPLPASVTWVDVSDCISLERFSTLSKILEDGGEQAIWFMALTNCQRLCDNLGLDVLKMAEIALNEMIEEIHFLLPGSGSEVPKWFTFRNYFEVNFNDYDETYYDLPFEIPWTSVLENTKLVLCAVWEFTESFVDCHLRFDYDLIFNVLIGEYVLNNLLEWDMFGGETGVVNALLQSYLLFDMKPKGDDDQLEQAIFRVQVLGKGLLIKSIGAHLAHISMSEDRDDDQGDAKRKHDNLELKEMQIDAELDEEQRWKRLKKAEENDALEATQAVKSSGRNFLDAVQTSVYGAERGGSSTIEGECTSPNTLFAGQI